MEIASNLHCCGPGSCLQVLSGYLMRCTDRCLPDMDRVKCSRPALAALCKAKCHVSGVHIIIYHREVHSQGHSLCCWDTFFWNEAANRKGVTDVIRYLPHTLVPVELERFHQPMQSL